MTGTTLGIALGLASASCQSVSYLQSRHFVGHETGGRLRLLFLSHVIQGVLSLALLPMLWSADLPPLRQYIGPLLVDAFAYLFGQACLFTALRYTEASRVAPFLAIKIAMLALLTCFWLKQVILPRQWCAVALAVTAAWILNSDGSGLPGKAILAIVLTCVGYAISDLYIRLTIDRMSPVSPLRAAMISVAMSYIVCGLAVLPLWWKVRGITWNDVRRATPYSLMWYISMAFLYGCFATVGVVLGGIVQSSRGLISILIAPLIARGEWGHLETSLSRTAFLRRAAVGILMMLAVALYVWK